MISAKPFRHALAAMSTSTGFTARNATTTKPSGDGVIDLLHQAYGYGGSVPDWVQLVPYGTNGDNDTFDLRVWGFSSTIDDTPVYVPQMLIDLSIILGATTCTPFVANGFIADTLTVNDGGADNGLWQRIVDAQEDLVASVLMHTRGCRYLLFDFDLAGGQEGVSMNCLWRGVEQITR